MMTSDNNTQLPNMKKIYYSVCILAISLGALTQAAPPEAQLPKTHLKLFKSRCYECHDSLMEEGDINLEDLSFNISKDMKTAGTWQKILNVINSGEMPPKDEKQIPAEMKAAFLDDLSNQLVAARKVLSDTGGVITMRRLNRREYRNTIESLLGVSININALPQGLGAGTFDTVGASQFMSSNQFEQYLKLGRSAIDEVFDRQAAQSQKPMVLRIEPEKTINPANEKEAKAIEERQKQFTRWQVGVDKVAKTPENQAKIEQLKKKHPSITHPINFYKYADRLEGTPNAKKFGFRDSPMAASSNPEWDRYQLAYHNHYLTLPHREKGTYLKLGHGTGRIDITPKKLPPGTYKLRIRAGVVEGTQASRRFIEVGHPQRKVPSWLRGIEGAPVSKHQITGTIAQPQIIETQLEVGAHTTREFAIQERQPTDLKALWDAHNALKRSNGYGHPPAIWIDWVEFEGPLAAAEGQSMAIDWWVGHDDDLNELARALKILKQFSRRALRGIEPGNDFIKSLLGLFENQRKIGEPFDIAIRTPLSVILASPGFLYLNEPGNEKERRKLNDRELAVRLAYFLWSAPPDSQLLELAKKDDLHKPEVLRQQVDRMIADPRSDQFVSGFVHQWLDMERLDFFQFDVNRHREFDESTRAASREEVYQSFTHLLRDSDNGRLGKLLYADYVMINGLLATYYGIDGVTGDEFRKVKLPKDSVRGGLLGMAAIHAMGSDGVESSPIERGVWVLRHLLNDPPPPAPPNVPQLSRLEGKPLSSRERVLAHQEQAQCASCHRKIDPIGFGMENFDAAGKWRTMALYPEGDKKKNKANKKNMWIIDPSGSFHKGPAFADFTEMRYLIAKWKEDKFARGFTEHLIEYALGRPFGFTDEDLAMNILSSAKSKNYSVSEFFQAIVTTKEFQSK